MNSSNCALCGKSKASLSCGICHDTICKKCAQFLDENEFSFLETKPSDLSHTTYCMTCFDHKVLPESLKYNDLMERAKNTAVFMKKQNKETRFIKRKEDEVKVIDCSDHDETILRLAFFAAKMDYNSIIDVEVTSRKVRNGNYQTTVFSGTGIPADVNENKLSKDRSFSTDPN